MFYSEFSGLSQLRWFKPLYFMCLVLLSLLLPSQRTALAQSQLEASAQMRPQLFSGHKPSALVTEPALYVDATRNLGVEDVSRQVFKPFNILLNRSFEPTTRWLKFKVQTPTGQQSPLVLVVGPYFLAELELYYEERGRWIKQLGGAKHPASQVNCYVGHHCFMLPDSDANQRDYFLRINTLNGFFVSTKVVTVDSLVNEAGSKSLFAGVQIGILSALIVWSALYFMRVRNVVIGWFCLTQLSTLFLYCFSRGIILHEFISESPDSYPTILTIILCLRLILATCLCLELSRFWQVRSWFRYYCFLWIAFWFGQIGLSVLGHNKPYMLLLNWMFLFTGSYFFAAAIYQSKQFSRQIRLVWTIGSLLVGAFMGADAVLLMTDSDISLLTMISGTVTSILVALVLYLSSLYFIKIKQEQLLQTMFELNMLKAQSDYEQLQLKERSTLIDMLSHELKNPLATMRMALGSLTSIFGRSEHSVELSERFSSMNQSIDNMTQVIDRVGQVDAIDQKNFVLRFEKLAVLETIENLSLVAEHTDRVKLLALREVITQTDRLLFLTIINNLIDNAIKYSSCDSLIEVTVSIVSTNKLLCIVSNEVEQNHEPDPTALFTRYYRGLYSHDKPGTGLGLVLIKSLCEILKGSVSYKFEDNRVFFFIELPL